MLLGPQHLIYNDELIQNMIHAQIAYYNDNSWGIAELDLNITSIESGVIEVIKLKAVFQDGSLVSIPGNATCKPLVLSLNNNKTTNNIYLCIPPFASKSLADKLESECSTVNQRSICIQDEIENKEEELIFSLYNVQLIATDKAPPHLHSVKIAEIGNENNEFVMKPYIPPLIKHNASLEYIAVLKKIFSFIYQLSENCEKVIKRMSGKELNVVHALLVICAKILTRLGMWINGTKAHPQKIYEELLLFYTELYAFLNKNSLNVRELVTLKYDHTRIYSNLNLLHSKMQSVVNAYQQRIQIVKQMVFDGTYYHANLENDLCKISSIAVMVSGDKNNFLAKAKIASKQLMPMLIANSLSGLMVKKIDLGIHLFGKAQNAEFYEISREGEIWDSIVRYENLVIYTPIKSKNCQISLVDLSGD